MSTLSPAADLSRACGALLSPTGELVVINARPAGTGSYESVLAIAIAGFG